MDNIRYKNKLFSVLGDSVSTLDKYTEPQDAAFYEGVKRFEADVFSPSDTWWGMVADSLGAKILVNNSFSGCCVTKRPGVMIPSFGCCDERTSSLHQENVVPDVIMVFMGINDYGHRAEISASDDERKDDISVFSVAYDQMLEKLKRNYPDAEIWCMTFPTTFRSNSDDFKFPHVLGGNKAADYCNAIVRSAEKYNCKVFDLYRSETAVDTIDGFHPNRIGMNSICEIVLRILSKEGN